MQLREVLINPISEEDEYLEFLDWANSIPEGRIDEGLIPIKIMNDQFLVFFSGSNKG